MEKELARLESRFLERLGEAGLQLPVTNRVAGGRRVDCRWPEQDRRREREVRARGDEFRRYSRDDVFADPCPMVAELRALLG